MNDPEHNPTPRKRTRWSICSTIRDGASSGFETPKGLEKWSLLFEKIPKQPFFLIGLGSLIWLLLRSAAHPRRLAYPCQRAALLSSLGFIGYLLSLLASTYLYRRLKQRVTPASIFFFTIALLITVGIKGDITVMPVRADPDLPAWTSPEAVSDVFVVEEVPVPECSLDGGALPTTLPCNDPEYALSDDGVDALIDLMASNGTHFYRTTLHNGGLVAANGVVIIKINNQWGGRGDDNGAGRMATNTDVLKGLIWRILQHPDGFSGEVVVAENTQNYITGCDWDAYPANAEDPSQSFQDVVHAFQSFDYPVSLYDWAGIFHDLVSGGSIEDSGYPTGEYIYGNTSDTYILLEDPAGTATNELSYPKFQTANGHYVSMRYGVWNGGSYDPERLTFINLPVLKRHGAPGATIAWKNLIGFITIADFEERYGGDGELHDFFFGVSKGYGLLGREIARIRAPDLNVVDAIWVPYEGHNTGNASRQDVLLASTDPFAVDWYASEYVLRPLAGGWSQYSAARGGKFRNSTRVNQNSAELVWPGGSQNYPYIDLLDDYDGKTPSDAEKNQLNVYVTRPAVSPGPNLANYLPIILK